MMINEDAIVQSMQGQVKFVKPVLGHRQRSWIGGTRAMQFTNDREHIDIAQSLHLLA